MTTKFVVPFCSAMWHTAAISYDDFQGDMQDRYEWLTDLNIPDIRWKYGECASLVQQLIIFTYEEDALAYTLRFK